MPPLLALTLCLTAVVFLLRLERKQCPQVTRALWIPAIWMFVIASRPIGLWFNARSTDPDASSPLDLAYLIILFLLALIVLSRRRALWTGAMKDNPWVLTLVLFMLVSILWSDIPDVSFKRWIKELLAVLMALVVFSEPHPRQAMESIFRRTTYILIPFSIILIKYFPDYAVDYGAWSGKQEWIGVAQQKNSLASMCVISAIFIIWSLLKRWKGSDPSVWKYQTHAEILLLLLTFYLLGGPDHSVFYSATSTYAFLGGMLCCAWIVLREKPGKRVKSGALMAVIVVLILLGVATVFVSGSGIRFFASSAGRDATLTGRTQVWTSLLPVVMKRPAFGRGFGGFWTSKTREAYQISGAHSGYLDVVLGIGLVGLVLVSMFLLSSCRKAMGERSQGADWGLLWSCYIIVAAIHNIGESSIDTFTAQLTAILLFFAIGSSGRLHISQAPVKLPDEAAPSDT